MLNGLYDDNNLYKQFLLFIMVQPLVDIYRVFVGNAIEVAGISLVELINIMFVAYLCVLFLLKQRRIRTFIPALGYAILLGIYSVVHCLNMLKFDTSIMTGTEINIISEMYVIFRMFILPALVLYMLLYIKVRKECFLKTMVYTGGFVSVLIVLTNLLKVSFISYASGLEKNEFVRQNIIEWFTKEPPSDMNLITSKGWFYSGNQIGLILLMLFPIVIYYAILRRRIRDYVLVAVQVVAMIMVATKTAALGAFLVLGIMEVLLVFWGIKEKCWNKYKKSAIVIAIIFAAGFLLLVNSPVIRAIKLQGSSHEQSKEEKELSKQLKNLSKGEKYDREEFIEFMNEFFYVYSVHEEYIKLLPVERYTDFWFSVVCDESKQQMNFRDFKQRIYQEVLVANNNEGDKYWGIGYTTNFPYVEKDIVSQNVWFGYFGTALFLGPYLLCFLYACFRILLRIREKMDLYICVLGMSICAGLMASLVAGHLFGYIFPITVFTFVVNQLKQSSESGKTDEDIVI